MHSSVEGHLGGFQFGAVMNYIHQLADRSGGIPWDTWLGPREGTCSVLGDTDIVMFLLIFETGSRMYPGWPGAQDLPASAS
jgi:hypothetical protein